jgi:hypothetical protein
MGTPVQWLTLAELRDELERTRPAWAALDLDGVPAHGHLPVLSMDTHCHQVVAGELLRRPCLEDTLGIECDDGHIPNNC